MRRCGRHMTKSGACKMKKPMELLAPAGGMEQLRAALRFGADAVYVGMKSYGLRAFAGNFDEADLRLGAEEAHRLGKKLYVTMNLLPADKDMEGFLAAARSAQTAGADAVIVSDIGAALMIRQELPKLPLHISTQANVLNTRTALHFSEAVGAERIILSREMSLKDIQTMRAGLPPDVELEAFVHGAMCVAYSGRCLLSGALVGRSGNRGECAQPCRWQYRVEEAKRPGEWMSVCEDERGTYLFSAYDLCMLEHLHELQAAGLQSLKIEGRMKTAYYVATVVSAYRRGLDLLEEKGEAAYTAALPGLMKELKKASHRASNTGFYYGQPTPPAGAEGFSQDMAYVGNILSDAAAGEEATVLLKNRFFVGDRLEALTPRGSYDFTLEGMRLADGGEAIQTASVAGTRLKIRFPFPVGQGDLLRGPNRNHKR